MPMSNDEFDWDSLKDPQERAKKRKNKRIEFITQMLGLVESSQGDKITIEDLTKLGIEAGVLPNDSLINREINRNTREHVADLISNLQSGESKAWMEMINWSLIPFSEDTPLYDKVKASSPFKDKCIVKAHRGVSDIYIKSVEITRQLETILPDDSDWFLIAIEPVEIKELAVLPLD